MADGADYWGAAAPVLENSFYGSPLLRPYLLEQVSGAPVESDPGPGWAEDFVISRYLSGQLPFAKCLSLCCGFGELERSLARRGVFRTCLGVDVSEGALEGARAAALAAGLDTITYHRMDLNHERPDPDSFDLVWANGAFHHLAQLEFAVEAAHAALRPGGWLVASEYVGPPRQDFPARQRELINALLHVVPERLRLAREDRFLPPVLRHRPRGIGGIYLRARRRWPSPAFRFGRIWDRDYRHFENVDPTEGVRSDEVIPILRSVFGSVTVHAYNGSLLPYVLERRFFEDFDPVRDQPLLDLMIAAERILTDEGEVEPDHAILVAQKASRRE